MNTRIVAIPAAVALSLVTSLASAHITLTYPAPRHADQKDGPCGVPSASDKRGTKVATFKPGATITVKWKETIGHTGHFRISFDDDGQDGFVEPASYDDLNSAPTVLVDGIKDKTGTQTYEQTVTLPDKECDNCTLQLIQMMTDKPPYGNGDDLYYQCADIKLSNDADGEEPTEEEPAEPAPDAGATPTQAAPADSGCNATPSGPTHVAILGAATALALGAILRRRRR